MEHQAKPSTTYTNTPPDRVSAKIRTLFCFCQNILLSQEPLYTGTQDIQHVKKAQRFVFVQHPVNTTGILIAKPHCLHH
jgi:hypothetical protein